MNLAARSHRTGLPHAYPGMRVGLLGGSFDPAHSGHAHVAEEALKRLGLDQVWWLVSPQNPLKPESSPLHERLASARAAARGRRMISTDIESRWGLRYTADMLDALKRAYPGVRFVWLMGADNLSSFRKWRRWGDIMRAAPIAIVSRPRSGPRALTAKPFAQFSQARIPSSAARALAVRRAPAWAFLPARFDPASSTALRRGRVNRIGAR